MIETAPYAAPAPAQGIANPHRSFRMVRAAEQIGDDRMAGSLPVYGGPTYRGDDDDTDTAAAQNAVAEKLDNATSITTKAPGSFGDALAYASNGAAASTDNGSDSFGFSDILEALNPLQHIPVVSYIYRQITGDEISPAAQVIGDTIYGGPIGGASALADVIVKYETGRDIAENLLAFVTNGDPGATRTPDRPEERLNEAVASLNEKPAGGADLPGSMLSFVDLGHGERRVFEHVPASADGRMAGTMISIRTETAVTDASLREPVTELSFSPMPS